MAKLVNKTEVVQKEELLVFGYSCKLFRDDEKATYIENGNHLIPWMGNSSHMIDRYDVRGALYDLDSAASVGANDTSYMSDVERKEEELCEKERYLALYHDLEAAADQEEEEKKRLLVELETGSTGFKQVGFSYDAPPGDNSELSSQQHLQPYYAQQQQQQHDQSTTIHPQGYTPQPDDDLFIPPPTLLLPTGLPVPTSIKQHKIIVKTAKFIAKQGSQMEIVLKTKQANNSMFGFLSFDNYLNHYYKHIISLIKTNRFREDVPSNNGNADGDAHEISFNPSADAAPGVKTPKAAVKTAPPADCSYSKLISKIRENQAKSGVNMAAATDSRPQSPLSETTTTSTNSSSTTSTTTPSATTTATSLATVAATTVVAPINNPVVATAAAPNEVPVTAALPVTSTPVPSVPSQPILTSKPFAGLVDYPSFNRTNEDDNDGYSLSESESDDDRSRSPAGFAKVSNGAVNGGRQIPAKNKLTSNVAAKKFVAPVAKEKKSSSTPSCSKDSFDDIRWPSPAEQMIIDKIACYIVKNGSKFEKAMKSRGDGRFQFLDADHDHFPYYQLKRDLYSEVFGGLISHNVSKRTERANDLKSVVASVDQVSSSIMHSRSWSTSKSTGNKISSGSSNSSSGAGAHTICFSIKQRRDQEVTLPATSFPLESSSSEEDVEDMDEEERERRAHERQERKKWRKMKREQFEKEKREKKEKDERAKRQEDERKAKQEKESQKLKELEEQENASGDEDLYDIFKYAQESSKDTEGGDAPSSQPRSPTPDKGASPALKSSKGRRKVSSDPKLRRKKAAHAFLSKLKGAPEDEPMIGPQLPPGMETMDISPKTSPIPSPAPSSPSRTPPHTGSSLTPPPRSSCTPPPPPPPLVASVGPAPAPAVVSTTAVPTATDDTDSLHSLLSGLPGVSKKARHSRHGLLAAAVTSLLTNVLLSMKQEMPATRAVIVMVVHAVAEKTVLELLFAEEIGGSADLHKKKSLDVKHRDDSKPRRHKQKRHRDLVSSPDRSSSRQRSVAPSSSKKRKRKRSHHRHHHKKRHHRSPHGRSSSSSHRKGSSSSHVAKKKKSSKSSSSSRKDRPKKKKAKRHRSASVSSVSSVSSSSSSSSRSSSTESSYRSRGSRRSARESTDESGSDPEVQIISDSDDENKKGSGGGSSTRASSVVSVTSSAARREASLPIATPASSRASSTSRDAGGIIGNEARLLSSGAASPALPPLPPIMSASSSPHPAKPLPSNFDMKTSTAMAKITQGLRAKVHALMDKKRPDD